MSHQIQVVIYHREVSKKALLSVLDSKMTRFGAMSHHIQVVIYHPEGSQNGVPKSVTLFGVPVFGPVLPRSSCNLPQNMVPGPKSTFWTHVTPYPGGVLPSEGGPISTFFYLGSLFGHLRMVKHHLDLV